jgi:hypothetical protein
MFHQITRINVVTSSKTYILDFKPIFHILGKELEEFYFYPNEVFGFIESCVLATQRPTDDETRSRYIVNDILGAYDSWSRKEEDHMARMSGSWINGRNSDSYCAAKLIPAATAIDHFVYLAMENLFEIHGPMAISATKFNWTPSGALSMEVSY